MVLLSKEPDDTDTVYVIDIPDYTYPIVNCDAASWSAPTNREISNAAIIEFAKPSVDLPSVRGFALRDDGGNILWKAALPPRSINRKDKLYLSPGELIVRA